MVNHKVCRIVITGGPGSGKTDFFGRLKGDAALTGFLFFDELARRILAANPELRNDLPTLHRMIYTQQVEREDTAEAQPFVTDRGTVDAFAFHPETMVDLGTRLEVEYRRYTAVIQLGSAAGLDEKHYRRDDIRNETPAEALEIEGTIRKVWRDHPNYTFVPAVDNLEEKYDRFRGLVAEEIDG